MYYSLIKKILFRLNPETSHHITLRALHFFHLLRVIKEFVPTVSAPCSVMGLNFPNPVGLAAGLDKNGDYIDALGDLGFGFLEVGTVTRYPQTGNPLPRLFRLEEQSALINRMGFNNKGVDYLLKRLKKTRYKGILGINIGKNRDTPLENAVEDYLYLFRAVSLYASYVTINVSSPNTEGLRTLQHGELLQTLLRTLKSEQNLIFKTTKKYIPLVVKVAPDLTQPELETMADIFEAEKIDAIIATNTTLNREGVETSPYAKEAGGLSGKPLKERATRIVSKFQHCFKGSIPIIASGGIMCGSDAREKKAAGAKLIQLYTGLIYQGPSLIEECVKSLCERVS